MGLFLCRVNKMRSVSDCAVKWWKKAFEELKRVKIIYYLFFVRFS